MTITPEQLNELERLSASVPWMDENVLRQLVAIARAALAWSEARWKHNDAALKHGIFSGEARTVFSAELDPLTEQLDVAVRGTPRSTP